MLVVDDTNHKTDEELQETIVNAVQKDLEPIEIINQAVINEPDATHVEEEVSVTLKSEDKPSKSKSKTKESNKSEKLSHKEKKKLKKEVIIYVD